MNRPQAPDPHRPVAPDPTLPHDAAAERELVGALMWETTTIADALMVIDGEDFWDLALGIVYDAIVRLYADRVPVTIPSVVGRISDDGLLDAVGDAPGLLVGLMEGVIPQKAAGLVRPMARRVRDAADLRRLDMAGRRLVNAVEDPAAATGHREVDALLRDHERAMTDLAMGRHKRLARGRTLPEVVNDVLLEATAEDSGPTGLPTGWGDLDRLVRLRDGALLIVAGRPSMGKSSFATNLVEHVCVHGGVRTLLFSLEVTTRQVVENMLRARAGVPASATGPRMNDAHVEDLNRAAAPLQDAPLTIYDEPDMDMGKIRALARAAAVGGDVGLVVVDYIQLVQLGERVESRHVEVGKISAALKSMARELDCPVVALSQLNRGAENRTDHRPRMADLRESGAIEQDADAVLLLFREGYYHEREDDDGATWADTPDPSQPQRAEVIVAKNRVGPCGTVGLHWIPELMVFRSIARGFAAGWADSAPTLDHVQ